MKTVERCSLLHCDPRSAAASNMVLYFIRHGESTHNAEGRIQGHSDAPLSSLGRQQSEAAAKALASIAFDAIYSSPLRRALETAQIIAAPHGLPVLTDPRLMELNVGVFQDRLRSELAERISSRTRTLAQRGRRFCDPRR